MIWSRGFFLEYRRGLLWLAAAFLLAGVNFIVLNGFVAHMAFSHVTAGICGFRQLKGREAGLTD